MDNTREPVALDDLLKALAEQIRPGLTTGTNSCGGTASSECPTCGGTGMYMLDVSALDPKYTLIMYCGCAAGTAIQDAILQRYESGGPGPTTRARSGMTAEYRARFERLRFARLFEAAALPFDMQAYTFDTFTAQPGLSDRQTAACKAAWQLATLGSVPSRGINRPGLFLWSHQPGLGKTGLAAAIVNHRLTHGEACLFMSTSALFDRIRATFNAESGASYDDVIDAVKNAPLLVLDDLDKCNRSEFVERVFYDVINHRYLHSSGPDHLITVITANAPLDDLTDYMNAATIDRIRAMCAVVEVAGPNLRR